MRLMFFLFISLVLVLSNVASASMLCCIDLDQPKMEQGAEPPCHTLNDDSPQTPNTQHECDCDACTSLIGILPASVDEQPLFIPIPSIVNDDFTSSFLATIYHPPITAS